MSVADLRGILISPGVKVELRIVKAKKAAVNVSRQFYFHVLYQLMKSRSLFGLFTFLQCDVISIC